MRISIIDCYTDEPSGLGVMPYIGTYPRYIFGALLQLKVDVFYLTIDDLRSSVSNYQDIEVAMKTPIKVRNRTPNSNNVFKILNSSDAVIIIAGVHTPGKYLSAYPGTTVEVRKLLDFIGIKKFSILTGPAANIGSGMYGGRFSRKISRDMESFDLIVPQLEYKLEELILNNFSIVPEVDVDYAVLREKAILGAKIVPQLPHMPNFMVAEIETMSGCKKYSPCSFCTEQIKSGEIIRRPTIDIVDEIKSLSINGLKNIRLGKQTCIYSYGAKSDLERLLKGIRPYVNVFHIDNANPLFVDMEKTNVIAKYCSSGNVASFGVESFDPIVIKRNNLGIDPELVLDKIKIINEAGSFRGSNGMPHLLPGINLLFGLTGESRRTHEENMSWLKRIIEEGLMVRRLNIREVVIFPNTQLARESGNKYLKKNRKHYWKWRNEIRQEIDNPMLERVVPNGTVLKNLRTEVYDGKTTFARQIGSYPLVVGIGGRLGLDRFIDVKVCGHMLRSVQGELI